MSFAELRAKAERAGQTGLDKAKSLRSDRPPAPSSAQHDPQPQPGVPPPPKARALPPRDAPPGALPPRHTSGMAKPQLPSRGSQDGGPAVPMRGPALSQNNGTAFTPVTTVGKERFFSLLDDYFATRGQHRVTTARRQPAAPEIRETIIHQQRTPDPAPQLRHTPVARSTSDRAGDFVLSHPPLAQRSCSAEDAAGDIALSQATSCWWEDNPPQPHSLRNRQDLMWTMAGMQSGLEKTVMGLALFSDLSMVWYRVSATAGARDPRSARLEALYAPRRPPLDHANAEWAAEVYNETVATFAEQAERRRRPVADGECWSLAAEAIRSIDPGLPKPVPSISRTHGSLIYEGKATGKGRQVGRWRGDDSHVRRGDVVEWRKVTISTVGAPPGSYSTLGAPDHTAVIVNDARPHTPPRDGSPLLPSDLRTLEVIEQSAGQLPTRRRYDLATFTAGEMWIYRPCGLEQLGLPGDIAAAWPPPVEAFPPR